MQAENLEQLQNFSIRLSGRADHLGLSQTALAEMLGIKLARVSNWFQGRNFPRTRERVELARRLGVRLEWLIHGLGDPENFSSDPVVNEAVAEYGVETHQVPVISWAHAGAAAAYEEMPRHFMGKISAMSRDTRAFALIVEGDSMELKIVAGDRVVELAAGGVTIDLEAPVSGRLVAQFFDEDETVVAGAVIAEFEVAE